MKNFQLDTTTGAAHAAILAFQEPIISRLGSLVNPEKKPLTSVGYPCRAAPLSR